MEREGLARPRGVGQPRGGGQQLVLEMVERGRQPTRLWSRRHRLEVEGRASSSSRRGQRQSVAGMGIK